MARRKLRFLQNTEQGEHTPTKPNEDFSGEEPPPKKTKSGARITSERVENGSACSSPSVSGFIVMPAQKPKPTSTGKKKTPSSKVFSDEDIIALLKGLAIFWAKGRNNKRAEFHNFIKGDLSNQPSKTQVSEKIRTLKKKFERVRANGGDLHIPDSHEKNVFQLSNVLWGDEEGESGCAGNEKEKGKGGEDEDEKDKIDGDDEDEKGRIGGGDETNKIEGEMKQVEDDGAVNKKKGKRKRKQVVDDVNESAEEKMKMREEDEKDKIGGGDEEDEKGRIGDDDEDEKGQIGGGDETNKIEGEMKQVEDGGAVNKKKRKRKQVVDEVNERAEEKMKMMEEDEKEKLGGGDEDEKGKIGGDDEDGKGQIGGGEETNKIEGEMKQVEDDGAVNKKQKKRKQVVDEVNESAEEKMKTREEDEKEKIGGGDEGEKGRIGGDDEDGKGQIGVGEETNKIEGEMKQVEDDGAVKRKQRKQKGKQEVNESAEEKMKMREEEFKCAFPLLYASLTPFKDKWMLIPLEKAQELEHTWTELKAEALGLELKRIDLMRRDILLHRQRA